MGEAGQGKSSAIGIAAMKRKAMAKHRAGTLYCDALDLAACEAGFTNWRGVVEANAKRPARRSAGAPCLLHPTHPPIGTPAALARGGNSTPALAPVDGVQQSPDSGPGVAE